MREHFSIHSQFIMTSKILLPKPENDIDIKGNCNPIYFINIDAKIPNKI